MPAQKIEDPVELMRNHVRCHAETFPGSPDPIGIEISALIHMLANLYDHLAEQGERAGGISRPRYGILMRLYVQEKHGAQDGLTPTELSQMHNVSKNTISSLLRGLEEKGFIQRSLDPLDKRVFRIQLTPSGRDQVETTSPYRLAFMNQILSDLNAEEQNQMIDLLTRLFHSISRHGHVKLSAVPFSKPK